MDHTYTCAHTHGHRPFMRLFRSFSTDLFILCPQWKKRVKPACGATLRPPTRCPSGNPTCHIHSTWRGPSLTWVTHTQERGGETPTPGAGPRPLGLHTADLPVFCSCCGVGMSGGLGVHVQHPPTTWTTQEGGTGGCADTSCQVWVACPYVPKHRSHTQCRRKVSLGWKGG